MNNITIGSNIQKKQETRSTDHTWKLYNICKQKKPVLETMDDFLSHSF